MALSKEDAGRRLVNAWQAGRLAHAYLISGPAGCGKDTLANDLARVILGADHKGAKHPDFHRVAPESKSRRIVIDQMRAMEQALQMKPLIGPNKVAVIEDADRLQPQAANAFLKTLEEPPPGCHIFLLTSLPEAMLETIVSRCICVQLRESGEPVASGSAQAIRKSLAEALVSTGGPTLASAVRFTRTFQASIAEVRERVTAEFEAELREELKRYRDSTDAKWREEREDQIKARAEALVVRERQDLLQAAAGLLVEALRHHHLKSESTPQDARRVAEFNPPPVLLKRIEALEHTRGLLARGVQEALALEAGFLQMITPR